MLERVVGYDHIARSASGNFSGRSDAIRVLNMGHSRTEQLQNSPLVVSVCGQRAISPTDDPRSEALLLQSPHQKRDHWRLSGTSGCKIPDADHWHTRLMNPPNPAIKQAVPDADHQSVSNSKNS